MRKREEGSGSGQHEKNADKKIRDKENEKLEKGTKGD